MEEVTIREIEYISEDAEEALVKVTDGTYECIAFCHPCNKVLDSIVEQPLLAFGSKGVEIVDSDSFGINRIGSTLRHEICGQIVDPVLGILRVGSILVELDTSIPGGIVVGSTVRLFCERIDLF
ncbi:hypothetical protein H6G89_33785 [Oscillatoria sp. FACHB-1407]|uniref:hypothetical protein n=1 Tax=Oscillatoria sp. FACHB-1407 TaxID=2692847 RepID=UPI0016896504|nr:hypothetical protein [Oscillatoria sp. FACHB-1407]MBD2465959.1 hypothetical protein [Oscillatoria sp. FACHB-1407]